MGNVSREWFEGLSREVDSGLYSGSLDIIFDRNTFYSGSLDQLFFY